MHLINCIPGLASPLLASNLMHVETFLPSPLSRLTYLGSHRAGLPSLYFHYDIFVFHNATGDKYLLTYFVHNRFVHPHSHLISLYLYFAQFEKCYYLKTKHNALSHYQNSAPESEAFCSRRGGCWKLPRQKRFGVSIRSSVRKTLFQESCSALFKSQ